MTRLRLAATRARTHRDDPIDLPDGAELSPMMETNLGRVAAAPRSTGAYRNVANPIVPERFVGTHEAQLGKQVGMSQFGVNRVTIDPGCATSLRHGHEAEDEFI